MLFERGGANNSSGGEDALVADDRANEQLRSSLHGVKPAGLPRTWGEPRLNLATRSSWCPTAVLPRKLVHLQLHRQEGFAVFLHDTLADLTRSATGFVEVSENPDILLLVGASSWIEQVVGDRRRRGEWLPVVGIVASPSIDSSWRVLDAGADDCLVGPFASAELVARLHAVLRRTTPALGDCAKVAVDRESRQIRLDGVVARVSRRQFEIFLCLLQHRNRWVSSREIIAAVTGTHHQETTSLVRVHIHGLRKAHGTLRTRIRSDGQRRYMFVFDES
jgi:DNA-binding response OmpR family regulator